MSPDLPGELRPFGGDPADLRAGELRERLLSSLDLSAHDGSSLVLIESRVEEVDLSAAILRRATLTDVVVDGGSWANADLSEATLKRVEVRGVRLTGVTLDGAKIVDATLVDCRIDMSSMRFARLERVRFEGCRMEGSDLYGAKLSCAVFDGCALERASLAEATFDGSEMRGCSLDGIGDPERLRGVGMPWADILRSAQVLAAAAGVHVVDDD